MKKIYLSFAIFCICLPVFSQIVIEGSDFIQPNSVLNYEYVADESFNLGYNLINNSGQDAVWNVENLTFSTENSEVYIPISALSGIIQMHFNNNAAPKWLSTHALEADIDMYLGELELPVEISEPRLYYRTDQTGYYNTGNSFNVMGFPLITQNEKVERIYKFPMHYGDSNDSSIKFSIELPMVGGYGQTGFRESVVDGEGILVTPGGEYEVLRVKSIIEITDSIALASSDEVQFFARPQQIDYAWLSPQVHGPILQITVMEDQIVFIRMLANEDIVGLEEITQNGVTFYPNPACDYLTYDSAFADKAVFSFYNTVGQLVLKTHAVQNQVNIKSLPTGIYVVKIQEDKDTIKTGKIVIAK